MAQGRLPQPGSKFGPCKTACAHKDCAATREDAATACRICNEPIGYDTGFYREDGKVLVHASCAHAEVRAA